jgi:hypothetical protein
MLLASGLTVSEMTELLALKDRVTLSFNAACESSNELAQIRTDVISRLVRAVRLNG